MSQFFHGHQDQKCQPKWQCDILRDRPTLRDAKRDCIQTLQPPKVEGTALIDSVQFDGKLFVALQERVADEKFSRTLEIRDLELISRNRVAQITNGQKASLDDSVQQFIGHLTEGDTFDHTFRNEANFIQSRCDDRFKSFAQNMLSRMSGGVQQFPEFMSPLIINQHRRNS